jgi:hypothetical protein
MDRWYLLIVVFIAVFLPLIIVSVAAGKQQTAAEERARERRMTEHKMNARLLRLNI